MTSKKKKPQKGSKPPIEAIPLEKEQGDNKFIVSAYWDTPLSREVVGGKERFVMNASGTKYTIPVDDERLQEMFKVAREIKQKYYPPENMAKYENYLYAKLLETRERVFGPYDQEVARLVNEKGDKSAILSNTEYAANIRPTTILKIYSDYRLYTTDESNPMTKEQAIERISQDYTGKINPSIISNLLEAKVAYDKADSDLGVYWRSRDGIADNIQNLGQMGFGKQVCAEEAFVTSIAAHVGGASNVIVSGYVDSNVENNGRSGEHMFLVSLDTKRPIDATALPNECILPNSNGGNILKSQSILCDEGTRISVYGMGPKQIGPGYGEYAVQNYHESKKLIADYERTHKANSGQQVTQAEDKTSEQVIHSKPHQQHNNALPRSFVEKTQHGNRVYVYNLDTHNFDLMKGEGSKMVVPNHKGEYHFETFSLVPMPKDHDKYAKWVKTSHGAKFERLETLTAKPKNVSMEEAPDEKMQKALEQFNEIKEKNPERGIAAADIAKNNLGKNNGQQIT